MDASNGQTKDRVQQVAVELFARHGYDGTSVREIVKAAGVTQPTLYYHFKSKEGLASAALAEGFERISEGLDRALASPEPRERLVQFVAANFTFTRDNPDLVRFFMAMLLGLGGRPAGIDVDGIRDAIIGRTRALTQDLADLGLMPASDVEPAAMLVLGLINVHILSKLDGWRELPTEPELRHLVDLLWQGIRRDVEMHEDDETDDTDAEA